MRHGLQLLYREKCIFFCAGLRRAHRHNFQDAGLFFVQVGAGNSPVLVQYLLGLL